MRRFFFHLVDGTDTLLDPEGQLLPDDSVRGVALIQARDCMAGEVRMGRLDMRQRIDVLDKAGNTVLSLPFDEAIELVLSS